jgi:hypothetical protein
MAATKFLFEYREGPVTPLVDENGDEYSVGVVADAEFEKKRYLAFAQVLGVEQGVIVWVKPFNGSDLDTWRGELEVAWFEPTWTGGIFRSSIAVIDALKGNGLGSAMYNLVVDKFIHVENGVEIIKATSMFESDSDDFRSVVNAWNKVHCGDCTFHKVTTQVGWNRSEMLKACQASFTAKMMKHHFGLVPTTVNVGDSARIWTLYTKIAA